MAKDVKDTLIQNWLQPVKETTIRCDYLALLRKLITTNMTSNSGNSATEKPNLHIYLFQINYQVFTHQLDPYVSSINMRTLNFAGNFSLKQVLSL